MSNPFVWNELHSTDVDRSREFFSRLFDWELQEMAMDDMHYTFINIDGEGRGGIMAQQHPDSPSMFLTYVQVDDLKTKTEQVTALGGEVVMADQQAGEYGRFSVVKDPTGALFALWQASAAS